jgi:hypothetical protein
MAGIVSDITQYLSVQDNLRQLNALIIELEDAIRSDPDVAAQIAPDVLALRTNYEAAASRYIDLYRAATGTVPSGLTGLGILPALPAWAVVTIAVLAAGVLILLSAALALKQLKDTIIAQKQATVAQSQSNLIQQAQDADTQATAADQRGDSTTAAQLRAQANALRAQATGLNTGGTDPLTFIQNNWPLLLLAGGAAYYALA